MPQPKRRAERPADPKQSPHYVAWKDRPEVKDRALRDRRRAMRAAGASDLELMATYKPNPPRLARLKRLRERLGIGQAEDAA